jgi:methionyl-tRNA synthetase
MNPADLKWGGLSDGLQIGDVAPVFPRLDKAKTMAEIKEGDTADNRAAGRRSARAQPTDGHTKRPGEAETQERSVQSPGVHATEAGAAPKSAIRTETEPSPPMKHATEADAAPGAEGTVSYIDITDFTKVDLRVGEVLTAERIPKSDKLLVLTVDIGEEKPRQILAGIAEHYEPEQIIGRKIAVVANLKPRKLRGYQSQGMLLAASVGEEDKPVIATFSEDVPNGARLK